MISVCPPPAPAPDEPAPPSGEPDVASLFAQLYTELHRSAARLMRGQPSDHTLQTTALVNEVYMRLCRRDAGDYNDKRHFLLAASGAMRHILIDHRRKKTSNRRPAGRVDVELDRIAIPFGERAIDLLALDEILTELATTSPTEAQILELRFFGGRTMDEISTLLEIPVRTLDRKWAALRQTLHDRLQ